MSKSVPLLGVVSVSLCAVAATAEAKLIRYEINGQRYSYSTNNRQQVKEARQRIDAAAVAAAAKARAEAEAAANPLVKLFGSPVQRDAAEAQARLQQIMPSEESADVTATSSVGRARGEGRRSAKARRERMQAVRQARLERNVQIGRAPKARAATGNAARKDAETPEIAQPEVKPVLETPALETSRPLSGGSDRPRERAPADADGGSLSDFVNRVRKAPDEAAPRL